MKSTKYYDNHLITSRDHFLFSNGPIFQLKRLKNFGGLEYAWEIYSTFYQYMF